MTKNMLKHVLVFLGAGLLSATGLVAGQGSQAANEILWEASRAGDTARITAALGQGAARPPAGVPADSGTQRRGGERIRVYRKRDLRSPPEPGE